MSRIPDAVLQQLRELEIELSEGDITVQGFEKKKAKLLGPYLSDSQPNAGQPRPLSTSSSGQGSLERRSPAPPVAAKSMSPHSYPSQQHHGHQTRAHMDAVQRALKQQSEDANAPMFHRRTSMLMSAATPSSSSSSSEPHPQNQQPVTTQQQSPAAVHPPVSPPVDRSQEPPPYQLGPPTANKPTGRSSPRFDRGAAGRAVAPSIRYPQQHVHQEPASGSGPETVIDGLPGNLVNMRKGGVSDKIQQLLNTLKRPKKNRKPIEEYYVEDDSTDGQAQEDPGAPKPVGPTMTPAVGPPLESRSDWMRNLEAAVQQYSVQYAKHPAVSVVDQHGKCSVSMTYSKLVGRAMKIAYYLLNKLGGGRALVPGDRVALVYSRADPSGFVSAFFGCVFAAIVPIAVDPPLSKDDPGGAQIGFLLGSLGVTVALSSELTTKTLPKEEGKDHIVHFRGWPKLTWLVTDHLPKPPKDWTPPTRPQPDSPMYIEQSLAKDGSALGVVVTRNAVLCHTRSLVTTCMYREGDVLVCTEDQKNGIGLWHAVIASIYTAMHAIFVPPSVMQSQPALWLIVASKQKANCIISSSRILSGCLSLVGHKEMKDVNLDAIRSLLLGDGANPWSLATSDAFADAYAVKGLSKDAVCPCAGSPEVLTLSLRRPMKSGSNTTGRGVMSMAGLSYGVVRVEEPGTLTSLTLQDVGLVMPAARIAVIKLTGNPVVCKTDEVGEIVVQSPATGSGYWGLSGKTSNTFKIQLFDERQGAETCYVRSGFLGFVGTGGLVFICGTLDGLLLVGGRRHNSEDLIATVIAVEPPSFVYKGRIAVFSVNVLRDERVVIVAEQKPNCADEEAFLWMNNVVKAVETIHGVNLYGVFLVANDKLPKDSKGAVHVQETRTRFMEGYLQAVNLMMCPHLCVTNLPTPKHHTTVSGAAQIIGDLVTGRAAESVSHYQSVPFEDHEGISRLQFISDVLRWRAQNQADNLLYTQLDTKGHAVQKLTTSQLHKRAERVAHFIQEKTRCNSGDHIALLYPPGVDLVVSFYACLYIGIVPVLIRPPSSHNLLAALPTIKVTLEISKSVATLTTHNICRLLKSKEAQAVIDLKNIPPPLETDDVPKKKLEKFYKAPTAELISYVDFSVSTTGVLSGVKMSHSAVMNMCRAHKHATELYSSREIALCLDPFSGLGLVLWCLSGVYSGYHTYLINPYDLEANPSLWLTTISQHKVRDSYCSYSVMDTCIRELATSASAMKSKGVDLSCVRSIIVTSEERPRVPLLSSFSHLFNQLGLSPKAVTASFGCKVNPAVCLQGIHNPESDSVYVDQRALRVDRVTVLERGSPHSVCLQECGKLMPGVKVAIVNPETRQTCAITDLGEIWVSSSHNGSGYYGLSGEANDQLSADHFHAVLPSDTTTIYARTGYLGFIKKSNKTAPDGSYYDSLYLVGSRDEAINIRGLRYHPVDIESSVVRCHKNIVESAVFTWTKLLVVVAELGADERMALDMVPVITSTLLEEHQIVAGIVVVVDPGTIPINSRGEKQRMHLRDSFLADEMDPIYVSYNL